MSLIEPNEQQKRAIECLDRDVVVEAGAGSGKTAVLARRFAHAVSGTDAEGFVADVDNILTITFTRKAAAELTERIRRVLAERGPDGISLSRRVDEAWVSTIDSLCSRITRRHVLEMGRDPDVRYASEVQAGQLRRDAARRTIVAWIAAHGDSGVIAYGFDELAASLMRDLEKLRAMGTRPSDVETTSTSVSQHVIRSAVDACTDLVAAIEGIGGPTNKTCEQNLASAQKIAAACGSCGDVRDSSSAGALLETLADTKFNASAKPKEAVVEAKERVGELVGELSDALLAPYAEEYLALLQAYADEYGRTKTSMGMMDFGDAVEGAALLFAQRPDVAASYRERFKLIMMDEFQDTNESQMKALDPIRDDNLCAVGDVQQSIYGFRYADVDVMRALAEEVDTELPLTMNYRSHPDVLHFINHVFASERLMGSEYAPLVPERTSGFVVPWRSDAPRVEMHLLDETLCEAGTRATEEAAVVACRVRDMIDAGVRPDDIAVLLRAMTHAPKIAAALSDHGVVAHLASGEAFFETPEIQDVRALLRVIGVPDDDASMIRVLAGPVGAFTDAGLLALASARQSGESLWRGLEAVSRGASDAPAHLVEEAAAVYARLGMLRDLEGAVSLTDLIHQAIHAFDYDLTLLASEARGPQAWSNVGKLVRMADEFERVSSGDTGAFLAYLADHEELVGREPVAPAAVAEGAVRIMSVHAAKGLEFPVVVVPNLGADLAGRTRGRMLLERDDGGTPRLAMRWPQDGSSLEALSDTLFEPLKTSRRSRDIAEEKRILYVALTRAEEALVLVGLANPVKPRETACGLFTQALDIEADTHSVVAGGAAVSVQWHVPRCVPDDESESAYSGAPTRTPPSFGKLEDALDESASILCSPEAPDPLPRSLSYTSLHTFDECAFRFFARYVLGITRLSRGESPALAIGTAVHRALQSDEPMSRAEALVGAGNMEPEQGGRVTAAVSGFVESRVAARLAAAECTYRERPFSVDLGQTRLEGKIDALAIEHDCTVIVDYKTGADAEASRSAERMVGYELQASCYALAALEDGAPIVEVIFVFVEQGCETMEFEFSQNDKVTIRASVEARVRSMERGEYPRLERPDELLCGECPAEGICPLSLA